MDARGNVTREEGPGGEITVRTFDGGDRPLTETIVIGAEDAVAGETNDLTTTYQYDALGNLEVTIDPRGNLTITEYDPHGAPVSTTTTQGTTSNEWDFSTGQLSSTTDANGNTTYFSYNERGDLTTVSTGAEMGWDEADYGGYFYGNFDEYFQNEYGDMFDIYVQNQFFDEEYFSTHYCQYEQQEIFHDDGAGGWYEYVDVYHCWDDGVSFDSDYDVYAGPFIADTDYLAYHDEQYLFYYAEFEAYNDYYVTYFDPAYDSDALVTNDYNQYGDITSTRPRGGRKTEFVYDALGNQIVSWYLSPTNQFLDVTEYDALDNVTGTRHLVLPAIDQVTEDLANIDFTAELYAPYIRWTTSTTYDAVGQVIGTTDRHGVRPPR